MSIVLIVTTQKGYLERIFICERRKKEWQEEYGGLGMGEKVYKFEITVSLYLPLPLKYRQTASFYLFCRLKCEQYNVNMIVTL